MGLEIFVPPDLFLTEFISMMDVCRKRSSRGDNSSSMRLNRLCVSVCRFLCWIVVVCFGSGAKSMFPIRASAGTSRICAKAVFSMQYVTRV